MSLSILAPEGTVTKTKTKIPQPLDLSLSRRSTMIHRLQNSPLTSWLWRIHRATDGTITLRPIWR